MDIVTNRISSNTCINVGKETKIYEIFDEIKVTKNKISKDIFEYLKYQTKTIHSKLYHFSLTEYYTQIQKQQSILSAWETQKIIKNIIEHYNNYIKQISKNNRFQSQKDFSITYYKKTKYGKNGDLLYKKGDVKEFSLKMKTTSTTNLLNYIKYINISEIETKAFNFKSSLKTLKNSFLLENDISKKAGYNKKKKDTFYSFAKNFK
jgi:hypothetical protein